MTGWLKALCKNWLDNQSQTPQKFILQWNISKTIHLCQDIFSGSDGEFGGGGVLDDKVLAVNWRLAVGAVHVEPVSAEVEVDAAGSNDGSGELDHLGLGGGGQLHIGGHVKSVLVVGLEAAALQVDCESAVVSTDEVLDAVLGENGFAGDGAGGRAGGAVSAGGRAASAHGVCGGQVSLGGLEARQGEGEDVPGQAILGVCSDGGLDVLVEGRLAVLHHRVAIGVAVARVAVDHVLLGVGKTHVGVDKLGGGGGRGGQGEQEQPVGRSGSQAGGKNSTIIVGFQGGVILLSL